MEVILYSKECNWYTRCCLLNGGVRYRETIVYKLSSDAVLSIVNSCVHHFQFTVNWLEFISVPFVQWLLLTHCVWNVNRPVGDSLLPNV